MAGMGERLWDIGRSPAQHMTVLVFGLLALLTGIVATSILAVAGGGGGATSIIMAALILRGIGGFFVTLALSLGAYAASGDSWTTTVWRIAQLLAAVLVLIFVFWVRDHPRGGAGAPPPSSFGVLPAIASFGLLCDSRGDGEDGRKEVADHLPRFGFVGASKELPGVRPNIHADRICGIDGHALAEHPEVSARAGQTLRGTVPSFAAVRRLPDGHLALGEDAVPRADQRRHERGVLLPRMGGDRKSEIGRQALRDFRPRSTVRSAMVGPAVVLLNEGAVPGCVPGELVHALAPLRILVREEPGPDATVLRRPAASAIPRLERADRTDSDDEMPRVPRVDEHGVKAQPPATWLPLLPRRMIVQRVHVVPRVPAVVAAEQGRGLDAGVDRVRRFRRSRFDVPDAGDAEIGALLELRGRSRRLRLLPGPAAVDPRSPRFAAHWRGCVDGAAVPRVQHHVVH